MTGMTLFKLCRRRSGAVTLGLSCDEDGIFLAGDYALVIPITDTTGRRLYHVRPITEINLAVSAAYGRRWTSPIGWPDYGWPRDT